MVESSSLLQPFPAFCKRPIEARSPLLPLAKYSVTGRLKIESVGLAIQRGQMLIMMRITPRPSMNSKILLQQGDNEAVGRPNPDGRYIPIQQSDRYRVVNLPQTPSICAIHRRLHSCYRGENTELQPAQNCAGFEIASVRIHACQR